jgi:two-component system OmpR family response regulator
MNPVYSILIVDDDIEIRYLLKNLLEKNGYSALECANGVDALGILGKVKVDLILLDIMMEGNDGMTLCKKIREKSYLPIIMISALSEPVDKVLALELGADDYITKPFYSREVLSRIKTILRRCVSNKSPEKSSFIKFEGWTLFPDNRVLLNPSGVQISLSVGEYVLLERLLDCANRIVSRDQLLSYIHSYAEHEVFDRSIDVQICRLRKRLEVNPKNPTMIKTVRNFGYIFEADIEKQ